MAFGDNNAPAAGSWKNIPDSFHTTDASRGMGAWTGYTLLKDHRLTYEKTVEPALAAGGTRILPSHAHGENTPPAQSDGVVLRKTWQANFMQYDGVRHLSRTVTDAAWVLIDYRRIMIPAFRGVHCEIEFRAAGGEDVIFKIDDNYESIRGGGPDDHQVIESNVTTYAAFQWHTVSGQLDSVGPANIEQLSTGDPASVTDTRSILDRWRLRAWVALAPGEGSATVDVRNVHWWPALDADT